MIANVQSPAPVRISLESAGLILTPEEFDAIEECDDNYRYELIDGVLVVNPIADLGEVGPNELLGHLFYAYQQYHKNGSSLDDSYPERYIRLPRSRRRADRVVYAGLGRQPVEEADTPSIAVEFVSRSRRDRARDYEIKRREYGKVGLKEYWIIDRFDRVLTVYRFGKRKPGIIVVREPDSYTTPLLPGFELKLAHILGYADRIVKANPPKPRKKKNP